MVADSVTDSELIHGSPVSRDISMKRKANWLCKLKQWKIDDRRKQWIYQWKRANVDEEEIGRRLKSLLKKLTDKKAWRIDYEEGSYGFTKCHDVDDDDDEIDLVKTSSARSPTSVLKSKGSVSEDCFCCSEQMTTEEEDEVFDDAYDNWDGFRDALNAFDNDEDDIPQLETGDLEQEEDLVPNTSQRTPEKLFHKDNKYKHDASSHQKTVQRNSKKKNKRSNSGNQEGDAEECPICSEVMDATDLSFQPCPCGFRICLFCHKRISENEARCPSCREQYVQTSNNSGEVGFQQRGRGTIRLSPSFRGLDRA
ncbi:hypothetical protein CARUB_v10020696mg [Capsella rubella]|uniref:RING-type domain-containing protein n=1 Tax=Capsella rubella TaxID=81985 RepID=R0GHZ7_9BRAS|nr:uncharacterized protein LOC17896597 [Capsella rubella]EOA35487.1 hypothetical protein CARUB_v10020696mg [Capsella rubella]